MRSIAASERGELKRYCPVALAAAADCSFHMIPSLAIGITISGGALAQILVPPVSFWLIDEFGWRMASKKPDEFKRRGMHGSR